MGPRATRVRSPGLIRGVPDCQTGSCPEARFAEIGRERQSVAPHVSQGDFWPHFINRPPEITSALPVIQEESITS
jgi:hypothetical protein